MKRYQAPKKGRKNNFLPSTPCTPEMRSEMVKVAKSRGCALAEIQREAYSLFLSTNYSKAIVSDSEPIVEAVP